MRYLTICLLGFAALTTACQPLTLSNMNSTLADPKAAKRTSTQALAKTISNNNSQDKNQTKTELTVEPTNTPSTSDSQDLSQTKTKLAVGDVRSSNDANTISKNPENFVSPMVFVAPQIFSPDDIIGFAIPVLIQDLGHATIIRQEGPVEIWQYHFKNCVVDFFFYLINESAPKLTAKNWNMRGTIIDSNLDRAACLAEINIYHQHVLANR